MSRDWQDIRLGRVPECLEVSRALSRLRECLDVTDHGDADPQQTPSVAVVRCCCWLTISSATAFPNLRRATRAAIPRTR
jgi:hypothetical protein